MWAKYFVVFSTFSKNACGSTLIIFLESENLILISNGLRFSLCRYNLNLLSGTTSAEKATMVLTCIQNQKVLDRAELSD